MSETSTIQPLPFVRHPHQHRFQAWAPKLSRCIVLTSWPAIQLWAWLEGSPDIKQYCERPTTAIIDGKDQLVDFWFQQGNEEHWWFIRTNDELPLEQETSGILSPPISNDVLEFISADSFAAHAIWIDNWLSILPYLASNARLVDPALITEVIVKCKTATTLRTIEQAHVNHDLMLVRTAIFMALHRGNLIGIDLHERRWDAMSQFIRSNRDHHAT